MAASKAASATSGKTTRRRKTAEYKATQEELIEFYKTMLLIRRFEEKAGQM